MLTTTVLSDQSAFNKQDQEKVNAFFAWDDVIEGKTCVDGKVFK
jgi:hypothetical protein